MSKRGIEWIKFTLSYCDVVAAYRIVGRPPEVELRVKLVTHVPRGYYYSFLNDAGKEAEEHYNTSHSDAETTTVITSNA